MRRTRLQAVTRPGDLQFSFQPPVPREQFNNLHTPNFIAQRGNVAALGPRDIGKAHLAISRSVTAAERGRGISYPLLANLNL